MWGLPYILTTISWHFPFNSHPPAIPLLSSLISQPFTTALVPHCSTPLSFVLPSFLFSYNFNFLSTPVSVPTILYTSPHWQKKTDLTRRGKPCSSGFLITSGISPEWEPPLLIFSALGFSHIKNILEGNTTSTSIMSTVYLVYARRNLKLENITTK
jgi:hypothetical protein